MKSWKSHTLGFTLIELMVAISIVAVLAVVAMTSFTRANMRARDGKRKADLEQVRGALEMYRTAQGSYPATGWDAMMTILTSTSDQYLSSEISDPKDTAPYIYSYTTPALPHVYSVCAVFETGSDSGDQPGLTCNGSQCCLYNP